MTSRKPRHAARLFSALLVSILATAAVAAIENEDPWSTTTSTDPVLRLTASNYQSTVFHSGMKLATQVNEMCWTVWYYMILFPLLACTTGKNGIVMFYQSWCGHSIRFKPWVQEVCDITCTHEPVFQPLVDSSHLLAHGISWQKKLIRQSSSPGLTVVLVHKMRYAAHPKLQPTLPSDISLMGQNTSTKTHSLWTH